MNGGFVRKTIIYEKWLYKKRDYLMKIVLFEKRFCKENDSVEKWFCKGSDTVRKGSV
jgi:hypothetical protein